MPCSATPNRIETLLARGGKTGLIVGLALGLIVGLVLGLIVGLAGGGYYADQEFFRGSDITDDETDDELPPPPPPPPNRQEIEQSIAEILGGFECASLSATLTDDLRLMVSGYLARDDDLRRLLNALSSVNGVRGVIESTSIRPWPFCAAMSVLEAQAGVGSEQPGRPAIRPNNPSLLYYEGDYLVVRATATTLFDGYLYIDFIDKQGSVYHLFPTNRRSDNRVVRGQEVIVGGRPDGHPGDLPLAFGPPFGTDMIVAVSSPTPLFAEMRPFEEPASTYLQSLSEALSGAFGLEHGPVASYIFVTHVP